MLTIVPPLANFIAGISCFIDSRTPVMLTSTSICQSARSISVSGPPAKTPAVLAATEAIPAAPGNRFELCCAGAKGQSVALG